MTIEAGRRKAAADHDLRFAIEAAFNSWLEELTGERCCDLPITTVTRHRNAFKAAVMASVDINAEDYEFATKVNYLIN